MKLVATLPLLSLALFSGCANRQTTTLQGPPAGVGIVEESGAPQFSAEMRTQFAAVLDEELYSEATVTRGSDFTLRWRPVEVDAGNRALRYFVGFGAGRGVIRMQGTLTDRKGRVLATKAVGDSQTIGFFGGDFGSAVQGVATDLADWAREEIARLRQRPPAATSSGRSSS